MFIEIKRINHNGEEKENLINTECVCSVIELTQDKVELFDGDGNLVETREPTERLFLVNLKGGKHLKVNEDTYKELVKTLTK